MANVSLRHLIVNIDRCAENMKMMGRLQSLDAFCKLDSLVQFMYVLISVSILRVTSKHNQELGHQTPNPAPKSKNN